MTASSRVALTFTDGTFTSSRLADIVERRAHVFNVDALASRSFALPPTEPDETPYEGVTCTLTEPPAAQPIRTARTMDEAPLALRRALEKAIERTLGDARSVAVMAGGGLDSAGLLALAVQWGRARGADVFAVALDFAGRCDDRPYLRALEATLGCEVIRVRPEEGAPHLRWLDGVDAAPFFWPSAPMETEMMARARARGAECVLMGVGGDETFDGEPQALAAVARRGDVIGAVRAARALRGFARPRSRTMSWILRPLVGRIAPPALRMRLARRRRAWVPAWAGPRLVRYIEALHARDLRALERNLRRGVVVDPAHWERHRAHLTWIRHHEEILAGIERRDPFLDRELVATVAGFEREWLLHGGIRRGLFREALRDLLPASLLEREDKAYFEPAYVGLTRAPAGLEEMRALASCDELVSLGLVDRASFQREFDAFVAAPDEGPPWMTIWPALCVERFLRASRARAAANRRSAA